MPVSLTMRSMGAQLQVLLILVAFIATFTRSSALPPPETGHRSRVIDKPLSGEDHFGGEDEGGEEEEDSLGGDHNAEYDHEAFLGSEESKSFDQLTPEESKEKLGLIYVKIDTDGDGLMSESELVAWIKHVQTRYIRTDTDRQWGDIMGTRDDSNDTTGKQGPLAWDAYSLRTYGRTEDYDPEGQDAGEQGEEGGYSYRNMMRRDRRRWGRADVNQDGMLDKVEFSAFLHPEDSDHMKDVVVDETIEDIDKNKDGQISMEEYIGDMWPNAGSDEEDPEWVRTEREQFMTFRDKDKDGAMNRAEVTDWILPPDYDHSLAEAKHLIFESDVDKDGSLTKDEVLSKYDLFVGSQATDFGEALTKHDEF